LSNENETLHLAGVTLFGWDREKALANLQKQGVSFVEAVTVFEDEGAALLPDPEHSDDESRFILIGHSYGRRMLTVVHVERGRILRIISAWPATRRERKIYEEKDQG
jgi:uncharacterized DUF497 family protein